MIIEHSIRYDKQLVITKDRLSILNGLISKYCQHVEYKANLEDGSSVTFDSYEELSEYGNYVGKSIEVLRIFGRSVRYSNGS